MAEAAVPVLARLAGGTALAALLLYSGASLERAAPSPGAGLGLGLVAVLGALAAVWALARLEARAEARWTAFVLLGVAPVTTFLGWWFVGMPGGVLGAILWLTLVTGLATATLVGWLVAASRGAPTVWTRARVG